MKGLFRIAGFFQTQGATLPPETAQVEISSTDKNEQKAEVSLPGNDDAFVSQQPPVGKDPKDAKEEEPLGLCLSCVAVVHDLSIAVLPLQTEHFLRMHKLGVLSM